MKFSFKTNQKGFENLIFATVGQFRNNFSKNISAFKDKLLILKSKGKVIFMIWHKENILLNA